MLLAPEDILLFIAAILAGALNAVAGGGTFIAFPILIASGMSALSANIVCSVSLAVGIIASAIGYRKEIAKYKKYLPLMGGIALIGSWLGAELLLQISPQDFDNIVPWLMLLATILFAGNKYITKASDKFFSSHHLIYSARIIFAAALMLIIAIYGGFFGAGMGIMMLAMMQCLGLTNIHEMNGLKTLLGIAIRLGAVTTFIISGAITWDKTITMSIGAVIGGYYAAYIALKIPQNIMRHFITAIAVTTTIYFFVR